MPFEHASCPTCAATVAGDGTRLDCIEVVDMTSFCNELDVQDFRKLASNVVTLAPQHQEAFGSLPANSWIKNAFRDLELMPLPPSTSMTDAIKYEVAMRTHLGVQFHGGSAIKNNIRESRRQDDSDIQDTLAVYAAWALENSPLDKMPEGMRRVAGIMYENLINDLDSTKLDSSARTTHWLLFLKILPRAFRIPIQAALASHSWRDAIILFQDGSHQACATTHEFIATFLTRVCVPVLTPDAFDAWVSTTAIDVNDAWHKNIDAIIEAVGLDVAKRVVVKEQSTWRGRASTIKVVSDEDEDDGDSIKQLTKTTVESDTPAQESKSESATKGPSSVSRGGETWHRLTDLTEGRLVRRGWWRAILNTMTPARGQPSIVDSDTTFIRWHGDNSPPTTDDESQKPPAAAEETDAERLSRLQKQLDQAQRTLAAHAQQELSREQREFKTRKAERRSGSSRRRSRRRGARQSAASSASESEDKPATGSQSATSKLGAPMRKQSAKKVERLQHAAEQIDPLGFSEFLSMNNVWGLRVRQLFTDTVTKEHSFHYGYLTGRVLRDGKFVYQALFKDGDKEELTASEVLQNVSNYARANSGGAAASSGSLPRKGRAGKGRKPKAQSRPWHRNGTARPLPLESQSSDAATASASDSSTSLDDSDHDNGSYERVPFCAAGCGERVPDLGAVCGNCDRGHCARADCGEPTFGRAFCSQRCEHITSRQRRGMPRDKKTCRKRASTSSTKRRAQQVPRLQTRDAASPQQVADMVEWATTYQPAKEDLIGQPIGKGECYERFTDVLENQSAEPDEILMQLSFTPQEASSYEIEEQHLKWIRRGQRAPPPPGSSSLKPGIVFEISDLDTRARGKIKMPSQFPDIYSNDRLEEVFSALDQQCSSGIAAAVADMHTRGVTNLKLLEAKGRVARWQKARTGFANLLRMLKIWLRDARHASTSTVRVNDTNQCWHYTAMILYLARRTRNHDLICYGKHEYLWTRAGPTFKHFNAAQEKSLRDPQREAYINSIAAYGKAKAPRAASSAIQRAPRRSSNQQRTSQAPQRRKRSRERLSDAQMRNAPAPLHIQMAGLCIKCGLSGHIGANCPAQRALDNGTADSGQKRMLSTCKNKVKEINRARSEYIRKEKGGAYKT